MIRRPPRSTRTDTLLPTRRSSDLLNAESKVVIERLAGRWIAEAAELKGMRKGEVEHLKGFLSRQNDTARMSYARLRSEEHTSELQSLMRTSYAVFCLKKKKRKHEQTRRNTHNHTITHKQNS